jgi:MoaA/NifB/PqqE/SkfB family radical SAM enzyme
MLHLTGKCNLTCTHCYMEGAPHRKERLPLKPVLDAIADCRTLGVGTLYITGGEPLMYRELTEVLEAAAIIPGLKTTLCSNGTLINALHVARFAALGVSLNISVDGEAEYHDDFRREPGAFEKTAEGIRRAVFSYVPVTVIMTVSRRNLASVGTMAEWAAAMRVNTLRFQPLLSLGRGTEISDDRLTPQQTAHLVLTASDIANRYRGRLGCGIIGQSKRFMQAHPCAAYVCNGAGCHRRIAREVKKIVVREDGTILPEATNLSPRFAIGHIGDGRLTRLVSRFLDDGYARFDALCRRTYAEIIPQWEAAVVPWDQIVAERSYEMDDAALACADIGKACASGCQTPVKSQRADVEAVH